MKFANWGGRLEFRSVIVKLGLKVVSGFCVFGTCDRKCGVGKGCDIQEDFFGAHSERRSGCYGCHGCGGWSRVLYLMMRLLGGAAFRRKSLRS